jgi:hypothetical protein
MQLVRGTCRQNKQFDSVVSCDMLLACLNCMLLFFIRQKVYTSNEINANCANEGLFHRWIGRFGFWPDFRLDVQR